MLRLIDKIIQHLRHKDKMPNIVETAKTAAQPAQTRPASRPKFKFDVMVYDKDLQDNGSVALKPRGQQIVEASSPNEVTSLFAMCDQVAKIIKVYKENQAPASIPQQPAQQQAPLVPAQPLSIAKPQLSNEHAAVIEHQKPKYYKVGSIELKNDNGKIFQKQWMRMTPTEELNFRLVNDASNKICSMSGKHLEMKKWIQVDGQDEDPASIEAESKIKDNLNEQDQSSD